MAPMRDAKAHLSGAVYGGAGKTHFDGLQEAVKATTRPNSISDLEQDPFSLRSIVMALRGPPPAPPPPPPPQTAQQGTCSLTWLPYEAICLILQHLDAASLRAVAGTCRFLKALAADGIAPGLSLSLLPHQRNAIRWMQRREAAPTPTAWSSASSAMQNCAAVHPTLACFPLGCDGVVEDSDIEGDSDAIMKRGVHTDHEAAFEEEEKEEEEEERLFLWADLGSGQCWINGEDMPSHQSSELRGGLFCDEPGLGKTITALSLVLRTKGTLPAPPAGMPATWFANPEAPEKRPTHGYYELPDELARNNTAAGFQPHDGRHRGEKGSRTRRKYATEVAVAVAAAEAAARAENEDQGLLCTPLKRRKSTGCEKGSEQQVDGGSWSSEIEDVETPELKAPPLASIGNSSTRPVLDEQGFPIKASISTHNVLQIDDEAALNLTAGQQKRENVIKIGDHRRPGVELQMLVCKLCGKWRPVPEDDWERAAPGPWSCYQHAWPDWRSCLVMDMYSNDENYFLLSAPGWVNLDMGDVPGSEHNIEYFRKLLRLLEVRFKHPWDFGDVFRWILKHTELNLPDALNFPRKAAGDPKGFGNFLVEIGYLPATRYPTQGGGWREGNVRPHWFSDSKHEQNDWVYYQKSDKYRYLRLDVSALYQALCRGPSASLSHRIILSAATLVIVPSDLVQHWKDQATWHTHTGALRVGVYDLAMQKTALPQSLAWDYDLVLTTFDILSREWDPKNRITCSALTQIHWLRVIIDEGHVVGTLDVTNRFQMALALRSERRWVMTGTPAPSAANAVTLKHAQPLLEFLKDPVLCASPKSFQLAVEKPLKDFPAAAAYRLAARLAQCTVRSSKQDVLGLPLRRRIVPLQFSPSHAASYNSFVELVRANLLLTDWLDPDHKESLLNAQNNSRASELEKNLLWACNVSGACDLMVTAGDLHETLGLIVHNLSTREFAALAGDATRRDGFRNMTASTAGLPPSDGKNMAGTSPLCLERFVGNCITATTDFGSFSAADRRRGKLRGGIPMQLAPPAPLSRGPPFFTEDHPLAALEDGLRNGGPCDRCGTAVRVLFVTPCACLLCVDCTAKSRQRCACCRVPYVMQHPNDPGRYKDNPRPKWPVPQQLIEWQPAYVQRGATGASAGAWQPDWISTESTKCQYLIDTLRELEMLPPSFNHQPWPPPQCASGGASYDRDCCHHQHENRSNRILGEPSTVHNQGRIGVSCFGGCSNDTASTASSEEPPPKAIVYSSIPIHLLLLEKALDAASPRSYWAEYRRQASGQLGNKALELARFRHDPRCRVLLMDDSGALGLDLSFVSHVFLMEPLMNKSKEEQIVSRAHRMGATVKAVEVQIIAMAGTLEEAILRRMGDWTEAHGGGDKNENEDDFVKFASRGGGDARDNLEDAAADVGNVVEDVLELLEAERRDVGKGMGGVKSGLAGAKQAAKQQEVVKRTERNALLLSLRPVVLKN